MILSSREHNPGNNSTQTKTKNK